MELTFNDSGIEEEADGKKGLDFCRCCRCWNERRAVEAGFGFDFWFRDEFGKTKFLATEE